eukprot:TRINITY_DN30299_c0_g1_i1.p1 TRINITY_DN30299_c0_g1~~TRINITY_DN30299_c0_g1_i1.p1  ORF type:complete len:137 (-),score=4.37 TRINITY_DN30299_c0_g1_i1:261-671(-)
MNLLLCLYCTAAFLPLVIMAEKKDPSSMSVRALKQILSDRAVNCAGCVEKRHLVDRVRETAHIKTKTEQVAEQLTPVSANSDPQIPTASHTTVNIPTVDLTAFKSGSTIKARCDERYNGTHCKFWGPVPDPPAMSI